MEVRLTSVPSHRSLEHNMVEKEAEKMIITGLGLLNSSFSNEIYPSKGSTGSLRKHHQLGTNLNR